MSRLNPRLRVWRYRLLIVAFFAHLTGTLQHAYIYADLGHDFTPPYVFPSEIGFAAVLFYLLWRKAPE